MLLETAKPPQLIRQKMVVTQDEINEMMPTDHGNPYVRVDGRLVPLMPLGNNKPQPEANVPDATLVALAAATTATGSPPIIDHSSVQTPVKDQLDRPTCVSFSLLAALEALIKRTQGGVEIDLSEQYAHWLFMNRQGMNQCAQGPYTVQAAGFLHQAGVCVEDLDPYQTLAEVTADCSAAPSLAASRQAFYGLGDYSSLFNHGLTGWSIGNTDLLESLLAQDHDIVVGFEGIFGLFDPDGILVVFVDELGNPWPVEAGHSMLAVGYLRDPVNPYFLFKNSWVDPGGDGYMKVSYDYVRQYATCGVVARTVRVDMPVSGNAGNPIPQPGMGLVA